MSIDTVTKRVKQPGRQGQELNIEYRTTITVDEPMTLVSVKIKNDVRSLDFSITRLSDGLQLTPNALLEKGEYYFNATAQYTETQAKTEETLIFNFKNKTQKLRVIEKKTTLSPSLLMK